MKLYRIRQQLESNPLPDVAAAVAEQLERVCMQGPTGEVAILVGSRGIANLPVIVKATGDWLKQQGTQPFLVPAMGSHNGATAAGQRQMIESLGVTEQAMEMPIRSSMECVQLAELPSGAVWMDRHCHESAGVLAINRIKLHTGFVGPLQSGLVKMIAVGMGKLEGARVFHAVPVSRKCEWLSEAAQTIVDTGKLLGGLAILEDGYDQTAEIHALLPDQLLQREPELLEHHRRYFPRLPVDELQVLIVGSMGKTFSGTGMDTNVIGRRGVVGLEDVTTPRIRMIGVLELSPASQGNAIGVGLADLITRRLRDAIDEEKTLINAATTGELARIRIPATLETDKQLIVTVQDRFGEHGWLLIPNTLHLDRLYASADVAEALRKHSHCEILEPPCEMQFVNECLQLDWTF